jgi:hypothetical protein
MKFHVVNVSRRLITPQRFLLSLLPKLAVLLFSLASTHVLAAQTISGTVVDPSGAVIAGARIEITGGELTQPIVLSSDARGRFSSADLKPGNYSLRATREGFEPLVKTIDLRPPWKLS